jgi:cytochrome P450
VCVGAAFATTEATLILARLLSKFSFEVHEPEKVRPIARLTTRPATEIRVSIRGLTT